MKDLWRYENDAGQGPYEVCRNVPHEDQIFKDMYSNHARSRPTWNVDIVAKHELRWVETADYKCGCPSLKKLRKWFKGYEDQMKTAGFKISHYQVRDDLYLNSFSRDQCAANLKGSTPVWRE